jgi:hypothetical protein
LLQIVVSLRANHQTWGALSLEAKCCMVAQFPALAIAGALSMKKMNEQI